VRYSQLFHNSIKLISGPDSEMVAYILKESEFYSKRFYVNNQVLIPRPETELLIEQALARIQNPACILDIGAGSGNISIVLAVLSSSAITAVECSPGARRVLKVNIARHKVQQKIRIDGNSLFPQKQQIFDMIVSNPPYLSTPEWQSLPEKIKNFEPLQALVAGPKGNELLAEIIKTAPRYLKTAGFLLLEIGFNQKTRVHQDLIKNKFSNIHWYADYNGIARVCSAQK